MAPDLAPQCIGQHEMGSKDFHTVITKYILRKGTAIVGLMSHPESGPPQFPTRESSQDRFGHPLEEDFFHSFLGLCTFHEWMSLTAS